jgi:hypothetical protein
LKQILGLFRVFVRVKDRAAKLEGFLGGIPRKLILQKKGIKGLICVVFGVIDETIRTNVIPGKTGIFLFLGEN